MNSIFRYLKNKLHVLLFLFLEIFCLISIIRSNRYQSAFYFSNTRKVAGKLQEANHSIFDYFDLNHKNQALSNENLRLRRQLKDNYLIESRKVFTVNDINPKSHEKSTAFNLFYLIFIPIKAQNARF